MSRSALTRWGLGLTMAIALLGMPACEGAPGEQGPAGEQGGQGEQGPPGEDGGVPTTSVEACLGCHGEDGVSPVGNIDEPNDAHHIDVTTDGRLTASGLRRMDATIRRVDVTGSSVQIGFDVIDENDDPVVILLATDGRFTINRLDEGVLDGLGEGDASRWVNLGSRASSAERFTSGTFDSPSAGSYTYVSALNPSAVVSAGDTIRVAIQLSAGDLPPENAWCDFISPATDCSGSVKQRDIVQTVDCNSCHGPTDDTMLAFHGGGRTDVEYCVTCHSPDLGDDGDADMTVMIHKIHAGSELTNGYRGYDHVNFIRDLDDCETCHMGGGTNLTNWKTVPTMDACESCHDDIDISAGVNHGRYDDNSFCIRCHPDDGDRSDSLLPVPAVHLGAKRKIEAGKYRGANSGYMIEELSFVPATGGDPDRLRVVYSVGYEGVLMDLETAPQWTNGGSLTLYVGWDTFEYTNQDSGATPAQPVRIDARAFGGAIMPIAGPRYEALIDVPDGATNTVSVHLEGRPTADLDDRIDVDSGDRIPVESTFAEIDIERGRATTIPRRVAVDSGLCNGCHDSAGAGISIHGTNRVGEVRVCAVCHNPDATDINRRPDPPDVGDDGKGEEAVDFKRMIHQIHTGKDLQNGLVIYGFGPTAHDFGSVGFTGNLANCKTCHDDLTYSDEDDISSYSTEAASLTLPTTIDTGADEGNPADDLNISSIASVCSSCHDGDVARKHMEQNGASFIALDKDIH